METWGDWTFSKENENLLVEVLNKFATEQWNLDEPRKSVLSTLTALSKVYKNNYPLHVQCTNFGVHYVSKFM